MNATNQTCPEPEALALFIDGALEGEELRRMTEHLATCEECMDVMRVAHPPEDVLDVQPRAEVVPIASRRRPPFWLALAASLVIVIAIAAIVLRVRRPDDRDRLATLAAAAPTAYRTVEPRLTGFRWAELRRLRDDAQSHADPEWLRLAGAAGEVLQETQNDASAGATHAAGVAKLLVEQPAPAVESLTNATNAAPSAAGYNDLAAAQYALAVNERQPSALPQALASADAAIRLDAHHAEAHFNRALILERMGLHRDAAAAWRAYLAIDATSPWAAEARQRLAAIERPQASFRSELASLESGDAAQIERVVRAFPQDARKWFETEVLGRYGASHDAKDLNAARVAGDALHRLNGDSLLADAAAVAPQFANAHAMYRRGRLHYRDLDFDAAIADLEEASRAFGTSPMSAVARFYIASIRVDQNRSAEASRMLDALLPSIPATHASLAADAHALRGRCALFDGRWSDAASDFTTASAAFQRLGETQNFANAEAGLGEALSSLGDRNTAWEHRLAAFDHMSHEGGPRLLAILAAAARAEVREERLDSSAALLRIEIDEAERGGNPLFIADAYKRRALHRARIGEIAAGLDDLRVARTLLTRTNDSAIRERIEAAATLAEGALLRASDARRSVALLTSSIDFLRRTGERFGLAEALLERGRSHRALRDFDAAQADFRDGLEAANGEKIADTAASLFEETVDLLLERGRTAEAFAVVERVRGGTTIDLASLPADAALIEYVRMPDGIAAFHITARALDVTRVRTNRATLNALVRRFRDDVVALASKATVDASSAALFELLVAPLPIGNARSITIISDGTLQTIPWAALYDRSARQYLVERYELAVAPSATAWLRSREHGIDVASSRLLLVSNDSRTNLAVLDHLRGETDALASLYTDRQILSGEEATPARFLRAANECDVIHFAGHARPNALLLAGELRVSDVANVRLRRPRLAVLAACSTLGADSMANAFLTAGVPSVIGTLWPIDDAHAARLFGELHQRLRDGDSPASALRHAQLSLLHSNAHPAAWAAAELLGG